MKTIKKMIRQTGTSAAVILFTVLSFSSGAAFADIKSVCDIFNSMGGGYSTSVTSVICNQQDHSHTITLTVQNDGSTGSNCQAISSYAVQASAGTYSNISVTIVYGGFYYSNINMGPSLSGESFTGFRIEGIGGIGNGHVGVFKVTYTLTGPLQDQQIAAHSSSLTYSASFIAQNFQTVMTCYNTDCSGGGLVGPTANNDNAVTTQNTPVVINVLANDVAGSGAIVPSTVAFVSGTQPNASTVGVFTVNAVSGAVTFTPVAAFTGAATISYKVCDVNNLCGTAIITVNVTAAALQPPVAVNDNASTVLNTAVNINILSNDIPGSGALVPSLVTFVAGTSPPVSTGIFTKNSSGLVTFTPATGFTGNATIHYTVCDVNSLCASAVITVVVSSGSGCPGDQDCDGCADNVDDYPNDPTRCFNNYYPASGYGTLAYEDLWPSRGDYDMNDVVVDYRFNTITDHNNMVVEIFGTFILKASGAYYHNGFGFQIPTNNVDPSKIHVTGYNLSHSIVSLNSHGLENGQVYPTIIVFDDFLSIMPNPGCGTGVNTTAGCTYVAPDTIIIHITFSSPMYQMSQTNIENFNPFIFVNQDRGHEVHLPDYVPTSLANPAFFSTFDDNTIPSANKYYKSSNNLPWAINIYQGFDYPAETVDIIHTYLHFTDWVTSGGMLYPDWYLDKPGYRNAVNIYTHH